MLTLTTLLLVTAFAPAVWAHQQGPPGDREVRTTRDLNNNLITELTLMLRGPKGPLPINLVIASVHKTNLRSEKTLSGLTMAFQTGLLVGPLDARDPQLTFILDEKTKAQTVRAFTLGDAIISAGVSGVSVPLDLALLARFAEAGTGRGRLLGIEFVLTPEQLKAIAQFAAPMLPRKPRL